MLLRIFLYLILLNINFRAVSAMVPQLDLIDSITAVTLPQGAYDLSVSAYTAGGILMKTVIGLHDNVYLGASFDIEHLIGDERIRFNVPGVVAKIKLTEGWDSFPMLVSIGYDSFYTGNEGKAVSENPLNRVIYGPYISITKPIFLFSEEQHFHFGIRMPVQPNYTPQDTALFISFDAPIGIFVPMFEINRLYFSTKRLNEILFNLGLKLNIFDHLSFELNFLIGYKTKVNRIFVLEYASQF